MPTLPLLWDIPLNEYYVLNQCVLSQQSNVGWLVVFYVPSRAWPSRDGTSIYCPLRKTWSSWIVAMFWILPVILKYSFLIDAVLYEGNNFIMNLIRNVSKNCNLTFLL